MKSKEYIKHHKKEDCDYCNSDRVIIGEFFQERKEKRGNKTDKLLKARILFTSIVIILLVIDILLPRC